MLHANKFHHFLHRVRGIIILGAVLFLSPVCICSYKYGDNDELIPFNTSKVIRTRKCCDGYLRTRRECILDYCKYFRCENSSKCVVVERCGEVFPIFVDEGGLLSKNCTQPKMSKRHLCPSDVCAADSECTATVCLANKCGCSPRPAFIRRKKNLREAWC